MNGSGKEFFSGPRFPGDQNIRIGGRRLCHEIEAVVYLGAVPDNVFPLQSLVRFWRRFLLPVLEDTGQRLPDFVQGKRFLDVFPGTVFNGLFCFVGSPLACYNDDIR